MLIGSEGILGVITEAWVRVQDRPTHKASAGVTFRDFAQGAEAVRALSQSGLYPANCRLLDPGEAALTGASQDGALLVLGFESADHPVERWMDRALELAADHGGTVATARRHRGGRRGLGRRLAGRVPARALPARHLRRLRGDQRDVRDGDHLGPLRGLPRVGDRRRRAGACARSAAAVA